MKIKIPIFKTLKKNFPRGLFTRSLIIIIAPIVLLQAILTFVFLERHWQLVTKKLSSSVVSEIGMMMDMQKNNELIEISSNAKKFYDINLRLLTNQRIDNDFRLPANLVEKTLSQELQNNLNNKYSIEDIPEEKKVIINIEVENGILEFVIPRRNVYATNSHIFLVWMVISSFLILSIAILFLRQQIKPIEKLAKAAESFGIGRKIKNFKPTGATEVRKAADAYIKMQERIEKFLEQRTLMLAGVSHDLRTPLTRIKLQLEMYSNQKGNTELLKDVNEMQYMLETYLDFSQTASSEEDTEVDLKELINSIISISKEKSKIISLKPTNLKNIKYICKKITLKRCIINLINNAKAFGDEILISLDKSNKEITITIEDNGPGIPKKDYEKALKPFQRLDSSRNQNIAGSGLGLSISQEIMNSIGGNIKLSKSKLGGLKVIIALPLKSNI
ncbi:ATP-binding protein [Hyphomicrobiales bacterium]|nr:ATP-binding protein [Hyphomicrobiales bacterium]